ncbi:MAG: metal ABC transporter substrate-binding protein [Candidatus Izemoplasmatales bacterium]
MKRILGALALILGLSATIACTPSETAYDVYATVYPLVYLVNEIAADTGVTAGMVPGISSHNQVADWSPKQIIAMKNAALLFYVGANLDAQIDNQIDGVFENLAAEGRLVKIENAIEFIEGVVHHHDDESGTTTEHEEPTTLGYDPHFWVSPERMILVATVVRDRLVSAFPDLAAAFTENHLALVARLETLSYAYENGIDAGTKRMMTSTNLYGYLKADYGIDTISISPGYHEETEQFTAQQKQEIVDDAILYGIQYIIFEKNASSPLSEAVLAALNESGLPYTVAKLDFNIMDTVPTDGSDYIQIMYRNLESIVTATTPTVTVTSQAR